nr:MAG TPA: hypothetical protein [Bacteriophage sp.]
MSVIEEVALKVLKPPFPIIPILALVERAAGLEAK